MIIRLAADDTGYTAFVQRDKDKAESEPLGKGTSPDEAMGHAIRELCLAGAFNRNVHDHPTEPLFWDYQYDVRISVVLMDN